MNSSDKIANFAGVLFVTKSSMKVHLFNPENDLALGLGCENYTPPPHAAAIHSAGALLPLWWAERGDGIIIPQDAKRDAEELCNELGIEVKLIFDKNNDSVLPLSDCEAAPWGWSLDAKRQFLRAGVSIGLPSNEEISKIRDLSHRKSSLKILQNLNQNLGENFPLPQVYTDARKVMEFAKEFPGAFVKSPWSGSGRGVFCALNLPHDALLRRAEGIIHRQGSVIVEKGLDKVLDFAALFYSDRKNVSFQGFSIFRAEERGMYSGNFVAPQTRLTEILGNYIDTRHLALIIKELEEILTHLISQSYMGYLGVDMMIYREDGIYRLMPCVELNLRMTMGVVAMKIAERLAIFTPHFLHWDFKPDSAITLAGSDRLLLPPSAGFRLLLSEEISFYSSLR